MNSRQGQGHCDPSILRKGGGKKRPLATGGEVDTRIFS